MASPITKNNLPEWIKAYGINWLHHNYEPKDDHDQLLFDYLERNGELVGLFLTILALFKRLNPSDGIFTQSDEESGKKVPLNAK